MIHVTRFWADPSAHGDLEQAGLTNIDELRTREFDWFETPNRRRGGWSGVSRIVLHPEANTGDKRPVFLKIQQNHFYLSWRNGFCKRLSYQREFHAIQSLKTRVDCIPRPLLYAEWKEQGNRGSVIVIEALDGWTCFGDWLSRAPEEKQIESVLKEIARQLKALHAKRWAHFGLFQKHVFLRFHGETPEIKLIDFEKARKCLTRTRCLLEDVSRFLRHGKNLSREQQKLFLQAYFETDCLGPKHHALIRRMRGVEVLA